MCRLLLIHIPLPFIQIGFQAGWFQGSGQGLLAGSVVRDEIPDFPVHLVAQNLDTPIPLLGQLAATVAAEVSHQLANEKAIPEE
jgi:hypothetical protein